MKTKTLKVSPADRYRADVLAGLVRPQKRLPAKYFYDAIGSQLFDRITGLDEYYLTRTEFSILRKNAPSIADRCGPNCLLIEPGAGSLDKVRLLLDELVTPAGFVPVDVSGEHLRNAARELDADYPDLPVYPVVADFTHRFHLPSVAADNSVVFFPGSTIGNFDPAEREQLLKSFASLVPGGGIILGFDLLKDPKIIEAAYNDAQGVTAAFNLNMLARINREFKADFDLNAFEHYAYFNANLGRIEMHLRSLKDQRVHVCGHIVDFREGETIHTENSYKFDLADFARRAQGLGLRLEQQWHDERDFFALLYFSVD